MIDGETGLLKFSGGIKTDEVSSRQFFGGISQAIGGLEGVIFPETSMLSVVVGLPVAAHKEDRAGNLAGDGNPSMLSISPLLITTSPQPQEPTVICLLKLSA